MAEDKEQTHLRIGIIGAGGIGCYYGARLQSTGQHVTFVARGAHLKVLRDRGLSLHHPDFNWEGKVEAMDLAVLTATTRPYEYDALLVCVKATATAEVAGVLRQWFDDSVSQTMVISLQNGIDNELQLAGVLGESQVIGGLAVRIGGHIVSPGVVEATGIAQVVMGVWPNAKGAAQGHYGLRLEQVAKVMNQAGIPARVVANIRHELWRKLVINNGVNPLSALTRLDTRTLSHDPAFAPIVLGLMREATQVAEADGERLTAEDAQEMFELIRSFDPIKTSMLVDLEKGRQLEVDSISGAVLARAQHLGLRVPYTETVHALLSQQLNRLA